MPKRVYIPQPGDEVRTTAIAPDFEEKTCRAKVRKTRGQRVELIYGLFSDRVWVPIASCRFVRKGTLSLADRDFCAACCG